MTNVGYLAVGALPCNSYVNYVTLKHLQILLFKYKGIHNFLFIHMLFVLKHLIKWSK